MACTRSGRARRRCSNGSRDGAFRLLLKSSTLTIMEFFWFLFQTECQLTCREVPGGGGGRGVAPLTTHKHSAAHKTKNQ